MQVDAREADLVEATRQQQDLLLMVFTKFRDILRDGHAEIAAFPTANGQQEGDQDSAGSPTPPHANMLANARKLVMLPMLKTHSACLMVKSATGALEGRQAWYAFTLATLRSFTRRYYRAVGAVAKQVEDDLFAEGCVPDEIRNAVLESLHL